MGDRELNELEACVAAHPEDPVLRWSLAKKLYLDGEFNRSVEHLRIIKDQWPNKANVRRYLAAGYYRLSRYDEAISELRSSIDQWDSDIPIREQLARVYEVSGRRGEAIAVWKEIQQIAPGHAMAVWALSRLQEGIPTGGGGNITPTADILNLTPVNGLTASDAGLKAGGGMLLPNATTCTECGSPNSEEFERCWRCRTPLKHAPTTQPTEGQTEVDAFVDPAVHFPIEEFTSRPRVPMWVYGVGGAVLLVGFWATKLSISAWMQYTQLGLDGMTKAPVSFDLILWNNLFPLRLILGGVLLLTWPLAIWISTLLLRGGGARFIEALVCGLFFATTGYLISWLPLYRIGYPALALLATSSVAFVLIFRHELGTAITAWIVQVLLILGIVGLTIVSVEGSLFLYDLPVIGNFEANMLKRLGAHEKNPVLAHGPTKFYTPVSLPIYWESSGSQWIDQRVGNVMFEIETDKPCPELSVTLEESGESLSTQTVKETPFSFNTNIEPDRRYTFTVKGKENTELRIRILSVLESRI